MMTPVRLQRKGTKGWRMEEESWLANGLPALYVGKESKWANPFGG